MTRIEVNVSTNSTVSSASYLTTLTTATSGVLSSQLLLTCHFYEFIVYSIIELIVCIVGAAGLYVLHLYISYFVFDEYANMQCYMHL